MSARPLVNLTRLLRSKDRIGPRRKKDHDAMMKALEAARKVEARRMRGVNPKTKKLKPEKKRKSAAEEIREANRLIKEVATKQGTSDIDVLARFISQARPEVASQVLSDLSGKMNPVALSLLSERILSLQGKAPVALMTARARPRIAGEMLDRREIPSGTEELGRLNLGREKGATRQAKKDFGGREVDLRAIDTGEFEDLSSRGLSEMGDLDELGLIVDKFGTAEGKARSAKNIMKYNEQRISNNKDNS